MSSRAERGIYSAPAGATQWLVADPAGLLARVGGSRPDCLHELRRGQRAGRPAPSQRLTGRRASGNMELSDHLAAQRAAKAAIRRYTMLLLGGFAGATVALYLIRRGPAGVGGVSNDDVFLLGLVAIGLTFYLAARVVQWRTLIKHDLRCPRCGEALATKVRLLRSPGMTCPACGGLALSKDP